MINSLFFDSYALIEILNGNPNYKKYSNFKAFITKLNIFEVYHKLLRDIGKPDADKFIHNYYAFCHDFDEQDIETASKLKIKNKKLSMSDCIGYALAKRIGIKFLTGDREFKNFDNVEFAE